MPSSSSLQQKKSKFIEDVNTAESDVIATCKNLASLKVASHSSQTHVPLSHDRTYFLYAKDLNKMQSLVQR